MYITLNNTTYADIRYSYNPSEVVYTGDSLTGIESVSGTIGVYSNDGFLLREDTVSDYARQVIRDGMITLTNRPEGYVPPPTIEQRVGELEQTNSISFRTMAENGEISEEIAAEYPDLFLAWDDDSDYEVGNLRSYDGELYKCLLAHHSQASWTPDVSPSLWVKVGNPIEEWPEWKQPISAETSYRLDAKVSHNDKHWISEIDYNTYEPGVYGWREVTD